MHISASRPIEINCLESLTWLDSSGIPGTTTNIEVDRFPTFSWRRLQPCTHREFHKTVMEVTHWNESWCTSKLNKQANSRPTATTYNKFQPSLLGSCNIQPTIRNSLRTASTLVCKEVCCKQITKLLKKCALDKRNKADSHSKFTKPGKAPILLIYRKKCEMQISFHFTNDKIMFAVKDNEILSWYILEYIIIKKMHRKCRLFRPVRKLKGIRQPMLLRLNRLRLRKQVWIPHSLGFKDAIYYPIPNSGNSHWPSLPDNLLNL